MPRRIPDYADAYYGWNLISSYGSIVAVAATVVFGVVLYRAFSAEPVSTTVNWTDLNYWTDATRYNSAARASSDTFEWIVRTPCPTHAFDTLAIE